MPAPLATHHFSLTALTPLLVGDGQSLSPIDYMLFKNQVNVLDQQLIFRKISKTARFDSYLSQLRAARRLDFAQWGGYAQSYATRRVPVSDDALVAEWERARDEEVHILTFKANAKGIFLPGSALLGGLRTALLRQKATTETLVQLEKDLAPESPFGRKTRLRRWENRNLQQDHLAGNLQCGDASCQDAGSLRVYWSKVATMPRSGNATDGGVRWKPTPTFFEAAKPGAIFQGKLSVGAKWNGTQTLQALHTSSLALLRGQVETAARLELTALHSNLRDLEASAQSFPENQLLLNLGWGAGFLSKSIVTRERVPMVKELLESGGHRRALQSGFPFPKSLRVVFLEGKPSTALGWAKLELAQ